MNCERCSTPMLWIGSMSRGGLDCPKCAAERPVIFYTGRGVRSGSGDCGDVFVDSPADGDVLVLTTVNAGTVVDLETLSLLAARRFALLAGKIRDAEEDARIKRLTAGISCSDELNPLAW